MPKPVHVCWVFFLLIHTTPMHNRDTPTFLLNYFNCLFLSLHVLPFSNRQLHILAMRMPPPLVTPVKGSICSSLSNDIRTYTTGWTDV